MASNKGINSRYVAYNALNSVEAGADLEGAISALFLRAGLSSADRSLSYAICMAALRNQVKIDYMIEAFCGSKRIDPEIRTILRIGFAQSFFLERIPSHAIVATSVDLARKIGKSSAAGFVNAILRKMDGFSFQSIDFQNDIDRICFETSIPRWLVERWIDRHSLDFTRALAEASNLEPPLIIRANTRLVTVDELHNSLLDKQIPCFIDERFPEYISIENRLDPTNLPGFDDGLFSVQDPAFGVPVWILAPRPGDRILEIGCAPGGKLSHLAEIAGGDIELHGLDVSEERLELTRQNLRRLKLEGDIILHLGDGRDLGLGGFDGILLDAPCTSLGVIRRHPEIRYRRNEEDITRMARVQSELIRSALRSLNPGGRLVFCSCSTEFEEGEGHFREIPEGFRLGKIVSGIPTEFFSGAFARTWPHLHGLDGAFSALIERSH